MRVGIAAIILDAANLETESTFWSELLGGTVERSEMHHVIRAPGQPIVAIQHAPGHVQPVWPDGVPQQIHLDLAVDDIRGSHDLALHLGARSLGQEVPDFDAPSGFHVYADPAGHPFCLCW
jgi:hypothetical protein